MTEDTNAAEIAVDEARAAVEEHNSTCATCLATRADEFNNCLAGWKLADALMDARRVAGDVPPAQDIPF